MNKIQIPRLFWYSVGVVTLFLLVFGIWCVVQPGDQEIFVLGDNIGQAAGWYLAALLCVISGFRWRSGGRTVYASRWIPWIFAVGLFCQGVGQSIYLYSVIHHLTLFPSWADAGFLGGLPFYLLGCMLLPTRPLSGLARLRVALDSFMLLITIFTLIWSFTLGPTLLMGSESWFARVVGTAYPLFDLLLISYILLISTRSIDRTLRPAIILLTISLVIIVLTDSVYDYQTLHNIYVNNWMDIGWPLGYLLLALSVQMAQWVANPQRESVPETTYRSVGLWRSLLPYVLLPIIVVVGIAIWRVDHGNTLTQGTLCCSALLLLLIFVRQIVQLRDTHMLNSTLHDLNARLHALATTDPLTELPNHRCLVGILDQEIASACQKHAPCALLFMDLDHFKALNDSYGHPAGDAALCEFGRLLRSILRSTDTVGRWGGEEFIAILPETESEQAVQIAERVRQHVANHTFAVGCGLSMTCSIGVACLAQHGNEREMLLQAADQAMYTAKHSGRNQVRCADDHRVQALFMQEGQNGGREETALAGTVQALMRLLSGYDSATGTHSVQVADLLRELGQFLGMPATEAQMVALAGQLHDLGKITIPVRILHKPEMLSNEERAWMASHPVVGAEVVACIPSLRSLAPIIRAHHERWDGTGYPDHLMGEQIPLASRLLTVVDAYVVMTTGRSYQQACSQEQALTELQRGIGTQFDAYAVDALRRLFLFRNEQQQSAVLSTVD